MEILESKLSSIRIPGATDSVYKSRCCIYGDTAKSEEGLYVDLTSFLAFGVRGLQLNFAATSHPVYLKINESSIGEVTYSILILPENISLPFPSMEFPQEVLTAVNAVLLAEDAEIKNSLRAADVISHAEDDSSTGPILPQVALLKEVSVINTPKQPGKKAHSGKSSKKSKGKLTNKNVKMFEQEDAPTFEVVSRLKLRPVVGEFREFEVFRLPVTVSWEQVLLHCASHMKVEYDMIEEYFSTAQTRNQSGKIAGFSGEEGWKIVREKVIKMFVHFRLVTPD